MFLFKNTKSKVKRIGLNISVYGLVGVLVLAILAALLPEDIASYVEILVGICFFAFVIGVVISIVCLSCGPIRRDTDKKEPETEIHNDEQPVICGAGDTDGLLESEEPKADKQQVVEVNEAEIKAQEDCTKASPAHDNAHTNQVPARDKADEQLNDYYFICSTCGRKLAKKYRHDNNVCVDCCCPAENLQAQPLTMTADDIENGGRIMSPEKKKAIQSLRADIIANIEKTPSLTYQLSSLLFADAARCFPNGYGFNWDGAWFKLDLQTGKLYANVSTYPNHFGASREDVYYLTAAEFYQKATEFNMSQKLQYMVTDEDWNELFDDQLQSAVARAAKELKVKQDKQAEEHRILYGTVIPDAFADKKPTMELDQISMELMQRFGDSRLSLDKKGDKYVLVSTYGGVSKRELSSMEAAWVEKQVNDCIRDNDRRTWQSMAGGDHMNVKICAAGKVVCERRWGTPIKKYVDLKNSLEKLAKYGSVSEAEKKNAKA